MMMSSMQSTFNDVFFVMSRFRSPTSPPRVSPPVPISKPLCVSLTLVRVSHLLCSTKLFHSVDGIIAGNFQNEPL